VDQEQQSGQQQRAQQLLAEMLEGWMTGEDAIEVALSHLPSNHAASPGVKKGHWTPEEDELVLGLVETIGTKWSEIVKHLPGREPNGIKNHFYSNMRRRRRMQLRAELAMSPNVGSFRGQGQGWGHQGQGQGCTTWQAPNETGKRKR
jgi:hypothetical protein